MQWLKRQSKISTDLKSVNSTDTRPIIDLKKEANDKGETITQLMGEIGTLKAQKQVLAEQIAEMEKDDFKAVTIGRLAAQRALNDVKSGQTDIAYACKIKKAYMDIYRSGDRCHEKPV